MDIKEIKRKIKLLKKFKKDTKVGTKHRRDINKQIRDLKDTIENDLHCSDPEKKAIIAKINSIFIHYSELGKYTVEQLTKYYLKIKTEYDNSLKGKINKILQGIYDKRKNKGKELLYYDIEEKEKREVTIWILKK